jgi:hypothetical protein
MIAVRESNRLKVKLIGFMCSFPRQRTVPRGWNAREDALSHIWARRSFSSSATMSEEETMGMGTLVPRRTAEAVA